MPETMGDIYYSSHYLMTQYARWSDQGRHLMSTSSLYMHRHICTHTTCTLILPIYTGKNILAVGHIGEFSCKLHNVTLSQTLPVYPSQNKQGSGSLPYMSGSDMVMLRNRAKVSITQDPLEGDPCGIDVEHTLSPTPAMPTQSCSPERLMAYLQKRGAREWNFPNSSTAACLLVVRGHIYRIFTRHCSEYTNQPLQEHS